MKPFKPFKLKLPYPTDNSNKQPVIRLKPPYYQTLNVIKAQTGLPLGNIVEQCVDYALMNMEGTSYDALMRMMGVNDDADA